MDPVQPFFTLSSERYYKKIIGRDGIAHLYEYVSNASETGSTMAIPDGSIDILFDLDSTRPYGYLAGTVLTGTPIVSLYDHRYFGVRFMPGFIPSFIAPFINDLIGNRIALSDIHLDEGSAIHLSPATLAEVLAELENFQARADLFLSLYRDLLYAGRASASSNAAFLAAAVENIIISSHGMVKVSELEEKTGYGARYIDRVMKDCTGLTPKEFCRIVRFQTAINQLDHHPASDLTDLAISCGYYDQAQFNHDFKALAGTTPRKHKMLITEQDYTSRLVLC
jgi:AraC-like DNA-binding protein